MEATLTLTVESKQGKTIPTQSHFQAPLAYSWRPSKLKEPLLLYLVNQAGLTLGGDRYATNIVVKKKSHAITTQQSYSKFSRGNGKKATERFNVTVEDDATLEWIGDLTMAYDSAEVEQETVLKLGSGSRLIWISGQMLGRIARGERLQFKKWKHRFEIYERSKRCFLEDWTLTPADNKKDLDVLLEHHSIMGIAIFSSPKINNAFFEELSQLCETSDREIMAGVTSLKPHIKLVRFCAFSGQAYRIFSQALWAKARFFLMGAAPPELGKF